MIFCFTRSNMTAYHDIDALRVSAVLEQQLFQEVEGALVRHTLTHLYHRLPGTSCEMRLAVGALEILDGVIYH